MADITGGSGDLAPPVNQMHIEAIFNMLKDAYADADNVDVTYDATYGFPESVQIDRGPGEDDSWGFRVSSRDPPQSSI